MDTYYKINALKKICHEENIDLSVYSFIKNKREDIAIPIDWNGIDYYEYPRKKGVSPLLKLLPYILTTRADKNLLQKLEQDYEPILLDGFHCCFFLPELRKRFQDRKIWVRVHNIEHFYYSELARSETNPMKKMYFLSEASKLKRIEFDYLAMATGIASISLFEGKILQRLLNGVSIEWIPAFLPEFNNYHSETVLPQHPDKCILFHGNFAIRDNQIAAEKLIFKILPKLSHEIKLILAGSKLSLWAEKLGINFESNIRISAHNNPANMKEIIHEADCIVAPVTQKSGVKLKILTTLSNGKPIFTTRQGIIGTGLEKQARFSGCIYRNDDELIEKIINFYSNPSPNKAFDSLFDEFDKIYNPHQNAKTLITRIFS